MAEILFASEPAPAFERRLLVPLIALMSRSTTMGLLAGPPLTALDADSVRRLLRALQQHGIGGTAAAALAPLTQPDAAPLDAEAERLAASGLRDRVEALEVGAGLGRSSGSDARLVGLLQGCRRLRCPPRPASSYNRSVRTGGCERKGR